MKQKSKKKLAILITISMLLCAFPATVTAEAPDVCLILDTDGSTVVEYYTDLSGALSDVTSGQTIQLLENITYKSPIVVTGAAITFDVNGKNLNVAPTTGHALEVGAGGDVRLMDSGSGGQFSVTGGGTGIWHGVYVHSGGKAEVTTAFTTASNWDSRNAYATGAGTVLTVYGDLPFGGGFYALNAHAGATVTVYGNVDGGGAMIVSGAGTNVTIYGGTSGGGTGVYAYDGATVYVKKNVKGGGVGVLAYGGAKVTVDGYIRAYDGGQIYIQLGNKSSGDRMQEDFVPVSSKAGYFEYNDGESYVWVKQFYPAIVLYTVTYDPGDHGDFEAVVHPNLKNDAATPAPPADPPGKSGWLFTGWDPAISDNVTGNATYVAQWEEDGSGGGGDPEPVLYTVTYAPGDHGTFDAVVHSDLESGSDTPQAPETPGESGWRFTGWDPAVSDNVTGNVTYVAQWEEDGDGGPVNPESVLYTVTYAPGDQGNFEAVVHSGLGNGSKTPKAPETPGNSGWKFTGWDPAISDTVTGNVTYVAQWKKDSEEIATGDNGNFGIVTPEKPVVTPQQPGVKPGPPDVNVEQSTDKYIPTGNGGELVRDGDKYVEVGQNGVPLGEWNWDEELETWVFHAYGPLSDIPQTGVGGVKSEITLILLLMAFGVVLRARMAMEK